MIKKHYNHYQTVRQRDVETVFKVVSLMVSDAMEMLKEQQNGILDRQMRENILRRQSQTNGANLSLTTTCRRRNGKQ